MTIENFDFAKLIHPIELSTFFDEYWEKQPLIISRQEPDYYRELLSMQDVDSVLYFTRPKPPEIKVVKNQQELLPSKYINSDGSLNLNQIYKAYDEGHTIVVNGLHQFWQPLAAFARDIQNFLNHNVIPNMYLSPKNSQGLSAHFDTHDVFVLQIEGAKIWKVYETFQPVPLLGSFQPVIPDERLPKLLHEVCLEAGDLLYMPRGFVHQAATGEPFSLHLTLGVYPIQWFDFIVNALTVMSLKDERFRRALPVKYLDRREALTEDLQGQLQELLQHFSQEAKAAEALEILADRFIRQGVTVPDGHFAQVDQADQIELDTVVARRDGMVCRVVSQGFTASIQFLGNTISGAGRMEPALRFIADHNEPFAVRDLPQITDEAKPVLVRRLVRGGLLRVVREK
jgi:ribosomal protein L16 Arg81 hydroxylase